ncbi:MAG: sulfatase-like hydrolase/transferase [Candidatus Lokiarchaeota archaeon]|nr:sulfatase-like hydrolase/transferase [Candidatus Lokiarchaeota archaeon]
MSKKPNIIYILQDHHAYYGHGKMFGGPEVQRPNLKRFAAQGVEFTRAYTACPLCGPARRTMLTGLYPHSHGEIKNETNHKYDKELYFEKLKQEGYELYYFGKWHAGKGVPMDFGCKGFSTPGYGNPYITPEYKEYLKEHDLPHFEVKIEHSLLDPNHNYTKVLDVYEGETHSPSFISSSEHASGIMTTPKETHETFFISTLACDQLEKIANSGNTRPFHMRVDFWGPHQPYYAAQEYFDLYDPESIPEYPSFREDLKDKPEIYKKDVNYPTAEDGELLYPNPLPWSVWQEIIVANYAQQTLMDEAIGKILDKLEELGLEENTMIIWTSDHGDALACHGGHFDKDVYMPEEMIRIPFFIRFPGKIPEGIKTEKLVSNIDVAPTILDVAGTKFSEPVHGRSVLSIFNEGKNNWREDLMCETNGHITKHLGRALIYNESKYIYNENALDELYNLEEDPYELHNLFHNEEYKEILSEMKNRLENWRNKTNDDITLDNIKGKRLKR